MTRFEERYFEDRILSLKGYAGLYKLHGVHNEQYTDSVRCIFKSHADDLFYVQVIINRPCLITSSLIEVLYRGFIEDPNLTDLERIIYGV